MTFKSEPFYLTAIRGAITCQSNTVEEIEAAVSELMNVLAKRNDLSPERIVSIVFSVTRDLTACFPASVARHQNGWESVALLDCQQMFVENDLKLCIRVLAHVWLSKDKSPQHPYLKEARLLRPDR